MLNRSGMTFGPQTTCAASVLSQALNPWRLWNSPRKKCALEDTGNTVREIVPKSSFSAPSPHHGGLGPVLDVPPHRAPASCRRSPQTFVRVVKP